MAGWLSHVFVGRKSSRKTQPKITVKYSAARLHEKGVVLEIEGLPHSQYVIYIDLGTAQICLVDIELYKLEVTAPAVSDSGSLRHP